MWKTTCVSLINKDLFKDELKLMKTSSKVENDKCFFSK